jgi:hypothetical protein
MQDDVDRTAVRVLDPSACRVDDQRCVIMAGETVSDPHDHVRDHGAILIADAEQITRSQWLDERLLPFAGLTLRPRDRMGMEFPLRRLRGKRSWTTFSTDS